MLFGLLGTVMAGYDGLEVCVGKLERTSRKSTVRYFKKIVKRLAQPRSQDCLKRLKRSRDCPLVLGR